MSDPKPQLHVTSIGTLLRCGMQFYYRYIKRIISPPAVIMIKGTATHKASEKDLSHKKETGELLSLDAVQDIARDSLNYNWQKGVELTKAEKSMGADKVRGQAVDSAVRMAEVVHNVFAPTITPVHLERPYTLELQGFPFDLAGYIDVQAVAGVDEAGNQVEKIIDLKTSAKSPPADKAHKSMQLTAYSLAASVLDGKPISQVELHYVVDTGRKVFACDPLVSARTPEDHAHFLRVVERAAEIIEKGAFAPADPDSWACSERFCGYAARCPFFRRGVQFSVSAEKEVA